MIVSKIFGATLGAETKLIDALDKLKLASGCIYDELEMMGKIDVKNHPYKKKLSEEEKEFDYTEDFKVGNKSSIRGDR
eukprot:TRINITY_DN1078_c0_g1_i1.p2 TRINITY_DN1078_c0_g1~~TRINITY_DN1078_c0_g1_i1.p2  ORF type:complete len:78 (-),score=15.95 TRINITY_DN1078_c0_g1_i1:169-402(-)